jgi:hypothetical protein
MKRQEELRRKEGVKKERKRKDERGELEKDKDREKEYQHRANTKYVDSRDSTVCRESNGLSHLFSHLPPPPLPPPHRLTGEIPASNLLDYSISTFSI